MRNTKKKKRDKSAVMKELDKEWSLYVRRRAGRCQKCGGNGQLSAHHAFGRRHLATRWDVMNGVALDYACHIHWAHHDTCSFAEWFRRLIGDAQYNRLSEAHNSIVKLTLEDLERMLEEIKSLE